MEGVAVRLVMGVEGEKESLGNPRFDLTNWVTDGAIYQSGKDRWRNGFCGGREL